jgi:MFS-type transporter involved in bile tolerance (Atg22 family)
LGLDDVRLGEFCIRHHCHGRRAPHLLQPSCRGNTFQPGHRYGVLERRPEHLAFDRGGPFSDPGYGFGYHARKKLFLAIFVGIGVLGTALLVFIETGDWVLASILAIIGRIGFNGANVFYDALLPHIARPEERDRISTRLCNGLSGRGLLLAINVIMIRAMPDTWGARLSFLSVAIWWAIFSIPIFRHVPEPPAATIKNKAGENILSASFERLWATLKDMQHYRELFKFLIAFLLYVDGIGTIIGVAAIYGAELGFGSLELILALLLVQFVGIPFSLIFGRLPDPNEKRRPLFLAFVLFNLVALPLVGIAAARLLPAEITGMPPTAFAATETAVGQGVILAGDPAVTFTGTWETETIPAGLSVSKKMSITLSPMR